MQHEGLTIFSSTMFWQVSCHIISYTGHGIWAGSKWWAFVQLLGGSTSSGSGREQEWLRDLVAECLPCRWSRPIASPLTSARSQTYFPNRICFKTKHTDIKWRIFIRFCEKTSSVNAQARQWLRHSLAKCLPFHLTSWVTSAMSQTRTVMTSVSVEIRLPTTESCCPVCRHFWRAWNSWDSTSSGTNHSNDLLLMIRSGSQVQRKL